MCRSSTERSSCMPSFIPGQRTIWVWRSIPAGRQPVQKLENGGSLTPEDPVAQLVLCGVDGDVERGKPLGDDALDFRLSDIGKGYVGAVKVGIPVVLVLDVEGAAHPAWQLMNEAKDAVVAALGRLGMLEMQPQRLLGILLHLQVPEFTVFFLDLQEKILPSSVDFKIEDIPDDISPDGKEKISGLQLQLLGDAAGFDLKNFQHA